MFVLNVLVPIFLVIGAGAVLRRSKFISDEMLTGMSRLAYWIGLPCLLLHKIADSPFDEIASGKTSLLVLIGMGSCLAVGIPAALALRLSRWQVGAFLQATFRGNLAFVGLATVISMFSALPNATRAVTDEAERVAVVALAPVVPAYNIVAVIVLLAFQHRLKRSALKDMFVQVLTNPLLIACAAGLIISLSGCKLPQAVNRSLQLAGQFALPLMLLCIGGRLADSEVSGQLLHAGIAGVIKTGIAPLAGYFAARWLGAGPIETTVALIMLASPTAIASYVLTEQVGGDASLSAGAIVISTLMSAVSLAVVIAYSAGILV